MNPVAMALLLTIGIGAFAVSAINRWRLLFASATRGARGSGHWRERWQRLLKDGLLQSRVRQYRVAGWAHSLVFLGFVVLLARTIMLFGRGFQSEFNLWFLGPEPTWGIPLGRIYDFTKDICSVLVLVAVAYFLVRRVWFKPARLKLSLEGVIILSVIAALMITDQLYEASRLVLMSAIPDHWQPVPSPFASAVAQLMKGMSPEKLAVFANIGLWGHSMLVLVFLNWLPHSKHFHIITALPNLFFAPVGPGGKLDPVAANAEELLERADRLQTTPEAGLTPIGISRIEDLSWKDRLDLFACTECGRCTEHCPASRTDKPLSPMQFTLDLRTALLASGSRLSKTNVASQTGSGLGENESALVPYVINPETVWSCTTCRACEEQCPVGIGYVDKIVNLRRDLVLMRGEVPASLQRSFDGLERHGNPWQLPREQRTDWTKELQIPRLADLPRTQVLYWVGCAASYDERAQRVARALVSLLRMAGVDFAILGKEETCTGDAARRAGNEYLFLQLAHANVETLNKYYGEGRFERIVTACPHCLTTLKHEYPDFGGKWPVFHHSQFLLELVQQGKLTPKDVSNTSVVLHDPCTLSRYANDWVSTRQLLKKVSNTALVEPEHNRNFTLCCGAGGSHMWMEDHGPLRMNEARTRELLATGAEKVVTACPFCSSMLGDGLARMRGGKHSELLDIAELLVESCGGGQT
jgi:Fe-S oxidoreductase